MFSIKKLKSGRKAVKSTSASFNAKKSKRRVNLCVSVDKRYKCLYHPLKQKYVNPKKLHLTEKLTYLGIPRFLEQDKFVNEKGS